MKSNDFLHFLLFVFRGSFGIQSQPACQVTSIPVFASPAVALHLNSGFPKPLAPIGAASQSYQLPPVADLLRLIS